MVTCHKSLDESPKRVCRTLLLLLRGFWGPLHTSVRYPNPSNHPKMVCVAIMLMRFERSWFWWRCASLLLASEPQHCRWPDCMGHSIVLLYSFPRRSQSSGSQSRYSSLEIPVSAIRGVGWIHWIDNYHSHRRVSRLFERETGQRHLSLHRISAYLYLLFP